MLKHLLINVIGHVSGLSDAQLEQIEQSLPATKALIDLLKRARPIIEQTQAWWIFRYSCRRELLGDPCGHRKIWYCPRTTPVSARRPLESYVCTILPRQT